MNNIISQSWVKRTLVVSALLLPAVSLHAEQIDSLRLGERLDEFTVTATKMTALKRELPISVSLLGKSFLEQTQFQSIRDINAHIPNVYIPDFGSSRSTPIFIRGIGSRRVNMIGFYSDGVPLIDGESLDMDYSDVRSIEVLRGPQGTLYGRGAMGGIINLTTYKPLDVKQMTNINLFAGNYGLFGLNAQSYQAINDKWGVSAALSYQHKGGYYENKFNGNLVDKGDNYSAKFGLQYNNRGWNANFFAQYQRKKQGGYPYALVAKDGTVGDVNYDGQGTYLRNLVTLGLSLQKVWNSGLMFKSGTSYQHLSDDMLMDQDFMPMDAITSSLQTKRNSITQEINLSQTYGRYSWVTGVYGFSTVADRVVDNKIKMLPRANQRVRYDYYEPNSTLALYHQSTYKLTDRLIAELGLRYEWEWSKQILNSQKTDYLGGGKVVSKEYPYFKSFQQFTPKFSLTYRLGQEHRVYAALQRGYQSGGFNLQFDNPSEQSYAPEYSWNYELGSHLYWLNGRLQVDASVFYIDWKQQQITQSLVTQLGHKITNAGHSKSMGAELSVSYRPTDPIYLAFSYGYTKATFEKYDEYNASAKKYISHDGNYIPQVPRQTLSAAASYTIKTGMKCFEEVKIGAQYRGLGDIYWDNANTQKQSFYNLLDAQISFQSKGYSLELWGRNLLDTKYSAYQFNSRGFNFAQKGTPLHFGGTLRIKL